MAQALGGVSGTVPDRGHSTCKGPLGVGYSELSGLLQPELEATVGDCGRGDQKGLKCQVKILALSLRLHGPGKDAFLEGFTASALLTSRAPQFFVVGPVLCVVGWLAASLTPAASSTPSSLSSNDQKRPQTGGRTRPPPPPLFRPTGMLERTGENMRGKGNLDES